MRRRFLIRSLAVVASVPAVAVSCAKCIVPDTANAAATSSSQTPSVRQGWSAATREMRPVKPMSGPGLLVPCRVLHVGPPLS